MATTAVEQKVLVLDFGAQYGQLIARRVRDLNVYSEIVPCDITAQEVSNLNPAALILSGGPASVYAEDAPAIDPRSSIWACPCSASATGTRPSPSIWAARSATPRRANTAQLTCT